jgi:hypothetical protein
MNCPLYYCTAESAPQTPIVSIGRQEARFITYLNSKQDVILSLTYEHPLVSVPGKCPYIDPGRGKKTRHIMNSPQWSQCHAPSFTRRTLLVDSHSFPNQYGNSGVPFPRTETQHILNNVRITLFNCLSKPTTNDKCTWAQSKSRYCRIADVLFSQYNPNCEEQLDPQYTDQP